MLQTIILMAVSNLVLLALITRRSNDTTPKAATPSVFASKHKIDSFGSSLTQKSAGDQFEEDDRRLIEMRSRPMDELLALAVQMEIKWRRIDWNQYARIMIRVSSEISNRSGNDALFRKESERFARIALSHSALFLWEHQADLVRALGSRVSPADDQWLRERREKAGLWLRAWQRLEKEFDPT